jgi:hypothetical protein
VVAALGHDDLGPEHARGVVQIEIVSQHDALLDLGHAGLVAGLGRALALEGVDQGRLADVGNAADQHAQRLGHAAAQRRELAAGRDDGLGRRGLAGVERDGPGAGLGVVMRQPLLGADRISQVLLVEHLERGLARRQLGQQGIGAGARQARVEQLDHDIELLGALEDRLPGGVHVTGKPLDRHLVLSGKRS